MMFPWSNINLLLGNLLASFLQIVLAFLHQKMLYRVLSKQAASILDISGIWTVDHRYIFSYIGHFLFPFDKQSIEIYWKNHVPRISHWRPQGWIQKIRKIFVSPELCIYLDKLLFGYSNLTLKPINILRVTPQELS